MSLCQGGASTWSLLGIITSVGWLAEKIRFEESLNTLNRTRRNVPSKSSEIDHRPDHSETQAAQRLPACRLRRSRPADLHADCPGIDLSPPPTSTHRRVRSQVPGV